MGMPYRGEYNAEVLRKLQENADSIIDGDYVVVEPRKVLNTQQASIERFDVDDASSFDPAPDEP